MRPARFVLPLIALLACAPSEPAPPSADDVRAAIEEQNAKFGEAVRAGDTAAIGALYSEDGAVLPPNAAKVSGRAAVAAFWGDVVAAGIGSAVLTTEEVAFTGGDIATEVGSALLSAKDGSVADEAKYVVVWKRVDGAWLLHRDIWNSNRPAAPPPAPPAAEAPAEGPGGG
jgi:uncharacterized protein (TIGR02246 family)